MITCLMTSGKLHPVSSKTSLHGYLEEEEEDKQLKAAPIESDGSRQGSVLCSRSGLWSLSPTQTQNSIQVELVLSF